MADDRKVKNYILANSRNWNQSMRENLKNNQLTANVSISLNSSNDSINRS